MISVQVTGGDELRTMLAGLGEDLERNVMRGALRAGAKVIADEARANVRNDEVRSSIKQGSDVGEGGQPFGYVRTSGKGSFIAPFLEYGTAPHLITKRGGSRAIDGISVTRASRTVDRHADGSLKIGANFVGQVVQHPGARPYPFLRPALDTKTDEAMAAMAAYVQSRLTAEGLKQSDAGEDQ